MDWESLKFFLALARKGSLLGAGRVLGVKHSTVLRRIGTLEDQLGLKLFDRHSSGCTLTAAGQEMLDSVIPVEDDLLAMERRLSGRDRRLTGTVRLAALEVLSPWICTALAKLRAGHPGIAVEVDISPNTVSLARHEADIALRVSAGPPENLVGRRIATLVHAVYAAETPATPDLAVSDWIGYSDSRAGIPQAQWVAANVPAEKIVLRTNHTATVLSAVRAGLGLALLPCYLGDADPGLRRIRTVAGLGQAMWILTHSDLVHTPRVRTVMDILTKELMLRRDLIEGRCERPAPR